MSTLSPTPLLTSLTPTFIFSAAQSTKPSSPRSSPATTELQPHLVAVPRNESGRHDNQHLRLVEPHLLVHSLGHKDHGNVVSIPAPETRQRPYESSRSPSLLQDALEHAVHALVFFVFLRTSSTTPSSSVTTGASRSSTASRTAAGLSSSSENDR